MSKKSNVHPDYYKTAGRDRPDDAARARLNRAVAAKSTSQQRPDRMAKGFYFERPEPAPGPEAAEVPAARARKKTEDRTPKRAAAQKGVTKKAGARKAPAARRTAIPRKAASRMRKSGTSAARPAKKR